MPSLVGSEMCIRDRSLTCSRPGRTCPPSPTPLLPAACWRRTPPARRREQGRRRPAKGAYPDADDWNEDDLGERPVSDKKVRRLRRQLSASAADDVARAVPDDAARAVPDDAARAVPDDEAPEA